MLENTMYIYVSLACMAARAAFEEMLARYNSFSNKVGPSSKLVTTSPADIGTD